MTGNPTQTLQVMKGGVPVSVKDCTKCKRSKPSWEFKPNRKQCLECNAKRNDRRDRPAERRASWAHGLRKIGASPEMYEEMFERQDGLCAICLKPEVADRRLTVDHCHTTGRIRGLLCRKCNSGIGLLGDNPELTQRATGYLTA